VEDVERHAESIGWAREPTAVLRGIPRFVPDDGYAESFGEQWARWRRVQLDSVTGKPLSRDRLVSGTVWSLEELRGETVLEVGCGAGRFTEVLAAAGAEV
jgi:2-polyprenyl-3-methyl-5-hydroxy-6-metoxy-1,4-benzoquinol methylase